MRGLRAPTVLCCREQPADTCPQVEQLDLQLHLQHTPATKDQSCRSGALLVARHARRLGGGAFSPAVGGGGCGGGGGGGAPAVPIVEDRAVPWHFDRLQVQ